MAITRLNATPAEISQINNTLNNALVYRGQTANDMNNYKTTGFWKVVGNISNFPDTSCYWGTLVAILSNGYLQQIFIANYGTTTGRIFMRTSTDSGSTYNSWIKVV